MKKYRKWLAAAGAAMMVTTVVLIGWGKAIFQRGNPLPYLMAAAQLDGDTPYVLAEETGERGFYIIGIDGTEAMLQMVEERFGARFTEQAGRGFFFEGNENRFTVTNEVYWGRYLVWDVPEI